VDRALIAVNSRRAFEEGEMAQAKDNPATWPLAKFSFKVRFGDEDNIASGFQAVSTAQDDAAKGGKSNPAPRRSHPDKPRIVSLRHGFVPAASGFWAWWPQGRGADAQPRTLTIALLDEAGAPTMTWRIEGARPIKVTSQPAGNGDQVVDLIELTYETFTTQPV
jgi:phage tail-like protein